MKIKKYVESLNILINIIFLNYIIKNILEFNIKLKYLKKEIDIYIYISKL